MTTKQAIIIEPCNDMFCDDAVQMIESQINDNDNNDSISCMSIADSGILDT